MVSRIQKVAQVTERYRSVRSRCQNEKTVCGWSSSCTDGRSNSWICYVSIFRSLVDRLEETETRPAMQKRVSGLVLPCGEGLPEPTPSGLGEPSPGIRWFIDIYRAAVPMKPGPHRSFPRVGPNRRFPRRRAAAGSVVAVPSICPVGAEGVVEERTEKARCRERAFNRERAHRERAFNRAP